jgi:predicted DNA-binding protein (MmcQ/YjbR family)
MVIPIASVLQEIYALLEEYEKDEFIRLKRAPKLPVFVSAF